MQYFEMSNMERLSIKRKIKRKKRIKFIVVLILIFSIIVCCLLGFTIYKNNGSLFSKKLNVKTTTMPEYVDVQLINIGFARTGVKI